jgi:hypothetical protein
MNNKRKMKKKKKTPSRKLKGKPLTGRNYLKNQVSDKGFVCRIYKGLLELKKDNPI